MHVYVVFAHPSHRSFTYEVLQAFLGGLEDGGHTHELGDLYAMDFQTDMDLDQYQRETGGDPTAPVPADVAAEHEKIERSDGLAFVYPVWWSDCPAKLKGWFDRVHTSGFAYVYEEGAHLTSRFHPEKALVLCPAGHTIEDLDKAGIAEAMRRVMIEDRLLGVGAKTAHMEILGGMVPGDAKVSERNLGRARELGRDF
jgi:NAD(P)H dehydrogenase (quinone)